MQELEGTIEVHEDSKRPTQHHSRVAFFEAFSKAERRSEPVFSPRFDNEAFITQGGQSQSFQYWIPDT